MYDSYQLYLNLVKNLPLKNIVHKYNKPINIYYIAMSRMANYDSSLARMEFLYPHSGGRIV